jgi:hypothetical protein
MQSCFAKARKIEEVGRKKKLAEKWRQEDKSLLFIFLPPSFCQQCSVAA